MSKRNKGKGKGLPSSDAPSSSPVSNPIFPRAGDNAPALTTPMQQLALNDNPATNTASAAKSLVLHKPLPSGKSGTAVRVLTNHFNINVKNLPASIYTSKVTVRLTTEANLGANNTPISSIIRRRVLQLLLKVPEYANQVYTDYDKVLISFKLLPDRVVTIDYYDLEEGAPRTGPDRVSFDVVISQGAPLLSTEAFKQLPANSGQLPDRVSSFEEDMNLILQRYVGQSKEMATSIRDNRVFYLKNINDGHEDLGHGLVAYRGFVRRARLLQAGHQLCVNTTTAAMYQPGKLMDLMKSFMGQAQFPQGPSKHLDEVVQNVNKFIKRLRVQGRFGSNKVKTISSLVCRGQQLQTVSTLRFTCDRHPRTKAQGTFDFTVHRWFLEAYTLNLDPNGLVIDVGPRGKPVYWPVDRCTVPAGQIYRALLPFAEQERKMIEIACKRPQTNINLIENEGLSLLGVNQTPLQIEVKMSTINGRRVLSPALEFGAGGGGGGGGGRGGSGQSTSQVVKPQDSATGQWNLRYRKFKQGACKNWAVAVFKHKKEDQHQVRNLEDFKRAIKEGIDSYCSGSSCKDLRQINIPPEAYQKWYEAVEGVQGYNIDKWLQSFFGKCYAKNIPYVFVILSDPKWYSAIKRAADTQGVQTTVTLRQKNMVKASGGEIANLMLKYNLKCGGINWTANIAGLAQKLGFGPNIMFMGADVIHPPAGAMLSAPSCAALVASTSPEPAQFAGHLELQHNEDRTKKSEEMIVKLDVMAISRLELWKRRNGQKLPSTIIMYRDGVSDGQFQQSLERELPLLRKACQKVYGDSNIRSLPRIVWQVCKKDHPARFYGPQPVSTHKGMKAQGGGGGSTSGGAFDPNRNPTPGLVVDTAVVTRDLCDWYAVPHKAIQGTAKPTHHYLLYSDFPSSSVNSDAIQALTHHMSFIFSRSVTSISNLSPARLADRLCDRAKHHLHHVYYPDTSSSSSSSSSAAAATAAAAAGQRPEYHADQHFKGQVDIHKDIRDTMYYL